MTTTDLSKKQLATILSALDDAPRSPANKGEALRAIGRSAQRLGLTIEDVLAAAPGLLDGRLTPAEFRAELQDPDTGPVPAPDAPQVAPEAQDGGAAGPQPQPPTEPAQAAPEAAGSEPAAQPEAAAETKAAPRAKRKAKALKPAKPGKVAPAGKPTPRGGTKQAQLIEMLQRPEGATVAQIAAATGWQHHTIRGAISGALKKKLKLNVEATRTREVGPNKVGAKGSTTVYRIVTPSGS